MSTIVMGIDQMAKREQENESIRSLCSNKCEGCGGKKKPRTSLCSSCYFRLDKKLQRRLYRNVGGGYEEAYAKAIESLGRLRNCE